LTERIDATLEDVQRALPQGMQIHRDLFRQADFIEQSLNNLFTAIIEGAALVILVVVVFLMNRASRGQHPAGAAVVACGRGHCDGPLWSHDQQHEPRPPRHCDSELVDDAIIDVENVVRRLRENAAGNPSRSGGSANLLPFECPLSQPLSDQTFANSWTIRPRVTWEHLQVPAGLAEEQAMRFSKEFWRRRPDLNRGWRFCRQGRIV
jgi:hypothetical protein